MLVGPPANLAELRHISNYHEHASPGGSMISLTSSDRGASMFQREAAEAFRIVKKLEGRGTRVEPALFINLARVRTNASRVANLWARTFSGGAAFFPYKTNSTRAVCQAIRSAHIGAEVCSDSEFRLALRDRHNARNIMVNGPAKSHELIASSILQGAIVNLDNLEEVRIACSTLRHSSAFTNSPRIGFRLRPVINTQQLSVFGMDRDQILTACRMVKDVCKDASLGIHLHLGLNAPIGNCFARALNDAADIARCFQSSGGKTFVNVGSGFWPPDWSTNRQQAVESALLTVGMIRRVLRKHLDLENSPVYTEPGET